MHETEQPQGMYISQVAQILGLSPAVLRGWERAGLIEPARTESGYRVYSPANVARLMDIRDLITNDGLNAAGAQRVLSSYGHGNRRPSSLGITSNVRVGERIRVLRIRQGVTLREVGARSDLSASSISAIERGLSAPSVSTLHRLAAALDTVVPDLLGTTLGDRPVVRSDERRLLLMETPGVQFENLYATDSVLQSILITVEPGCGSEESYSHEGEEFLYIVQGTLDITLDELHDYRLNTGDAMTFASTRPHRWTNPGDKKVVIVWINTPPTF